MFLIDQARTHLTQLALRWNLPLHDKHLEKINIVGHGLHLFKYSNFVLGKLVQAEKDRADLCLQTSDLCFQI